MSTVNARPALAAMGRRWLWPCLGLGIAALVAIAWLNADKLRLFAPVTTDAPHEDAAAHTDSDHAEHSLSPDVLELSPQAQANLGVKLATVQLQRYERVITVPGIITERPGKSRLEITAPLTGVVTKIQIARGEAVEPEQVLFQLRLTHEELVQVQAEFLRTAEELDVVEREVARLENLATSGSIAGKTLLERRYEKQKSEAAMRAQRQALMLHGFSNEQVDEILRTRTLLQFLDVRAPSAEMSAGAESPPRFQVLELSVKRGQHVDAGATLAELGDYQLLFIEGTAFEQEIPAIHALASQDWKVSAVIDSEGTNPQVIPDLELEFLEAKVDAESRAFHFYVLLPNELAPSKRPEGVGQMITWKYKPGQRVQLRVPIEKLPDCIVLPATAVAKDGLETYVFQQNGRNFQRRPVQVAVQDPLSVVIANDGSLFPGDKVAANGAQQMLIALKNKSGGAIDPHAGHNH